MRKGAKETFSMDTRTPEQIAADDKAAADKAAAKTRADQIAAEQKAKDDAAKAAGKTPLTGLQHPLNVAAVAKIKEMAATLRDPKRTPEQHVQVADQIDKELANL
jgi:hypothetical protein